MAEKNLNLPLNGNNSTILLLLVVERRSTFSVYVGLSGFLYD